MDKHTNTVFEKSLKYHNVDPSQSRWEILAKKTPHMILTRGGDSGDLMGNDIVQICPCGHLLYIDNDVTPYSCSFALCFQRPGICNHVAGWAKWRCFFSHPLLPFAIIDSSKLSCLSLPNALNQLTPTQYQMNGWENLKHAAHSK